MIIDVHLGDKQSCRYAIIEGDAKWGKRDDFGTRVKWNSLLGSKSGPKNQMISKRFYKKKRVNDTGGQEDSLPK